MTLIHSRTLAQITMRDVGEAAHVSRASLYRYFPSKASLLSAIADDRRNRFGQTLSTVIAKSDDGEQLLGSLVGFLKEYYETQDPMHFLEREPTFTIDTFRNTLPYYMSLITNAREDFTPFGKRNDVPIDLVAELLLRLMLSDVLVPSKPQPIFIIRFLPYLRALLHIDNVLDLPEVAEAKPPRRVAAKTRTRNVAKSSRRAKAS